MLHRAPPRGTEQRDQRDRKDGEADRDRRRRAGERAVDAEAREHEHDADREPSAGLCDERRAHPHEAREALQQAEAEGEAEREEQRQPEQGDGECGQCERAGDRSGQDRDEQPDGGRASADAHGPAAYERVERRLLVARAVLRGQLRRRGLDDLARDRLEDQDPEERGEYRVILGSQQARHDDLVAATNR